MVPRRRRDCRTPCNDLGCRGHERRPRFAWLSGFACCGRRGARCRVPGRAIKATGTPLFEIKLNNFWKAEGLMAT